MMKNVVQKIQKIPFLFMLVLVFFTCISASAQIQIKGTVVSANDSEPMIGVAILEEGTSNGRITDLNGNYSIQVSNSNATLTASFIGYKTQTVKVNGRSVINFRLEEDTQVLDEVVVVGYGVQRKSDLTGAVCCADEINLQCLPEHLMARVQPAHCYHRGFYDRIVLRHAQNGGRSGRWSDPDVF